MNPALLAAMRPRVRFESQAPELPPGAPTNLRTTAVSTTAVSLAWDAPSGGGAVTGYDLLRGGVVIQSGVSTLSATDSTVTAGQGYSYTVRAVGPGGVGPESAALAVEVPGEGGEILAATDLDSGELGGFGMNSPGDRGDWTIIPDPTPRAQGNVMRMRYYPPGDPEVYFTWYPNGSVGAGDTIFSYGQFYIVDNGYYGNRKIWRFYCGPQSTFSSDMTLWMSTTLRAEGFHTPNRTGVFENTQAPVPTNTWHELEVQLTLDSAINARDGILRVWLNRSLIFERTNYGFISNEHPTLSVIRPGNQTQSTREQNGSLTDERYWDNMVISTERVAP